MPHLPVAGALWGLTDTAQFAIIQKAAVDHQVVETQSDVLYFQGSLQPLPVRELLIKPEGQRTWKFYKMFTKQVLKLDDEVQDLAQRRYRVTGTADWGSLGGFYEYELKEEPKP